MAKYRLIVLQGKQIGTHLDLEEGKEFFLGRKKDCELYLQDDLLSRRHCRLFFKQGTLFIEDMKSLNGTLVNGNAISFCPLALGDIISIGEHLLKCESEDAVFQSTAEQILCCRCGASIAFPQSKPPYICSRCYHNYTKTKDRHQNLGTFGPYEIQSLLGEGGIGAVYFAIDSRNGTRLALKILKDATATSEAYRKRFEREAKIYTKLSHSNLIKMYETGKINESLFIAMEYVSGQNLHDYVGRMGPLTCVQALQILKQTTDGIAYAHEAGVIHRDIKPGNILIASNLEVKVVDFGLGKVLDAAMMTEFTSEGSGLGSLMYASPEQIVDARHVNELTDIYGLGATLYFTLTAVHPFAASTPTETLIKIQNGNLDYQAFPKQTAPRVIALIEKSLRLNPQHRYPSARDLNIEVESILKELPT
ncbi:MAG: FHA domain-containing serine/threonine-protein kinase [Planctomycetota bacterium]